MKNLNFKERLRKVNFKAKSRKGFVFTILTLVIIVFMIIELNIYFRTYELKLQSEPGKLRLQVMNDFIREYSPFNFNNTVQIFLYSALYELNNDSIKYPPNQTNLAQLLWNISYTGNRTDYSPKILLQSENTLSAHDFKLKDLAKSMGIDLNITYSNFAIGLTDPWTVQYNFTMFVNMYDSNSMTRVSFPANISVNISIQGFQDPFLARLNFTRNIIPMNRSPQMSVLLTGERGMGWFYGVTEKVTNCNNVLFNPDNKLKIMATDNLGVANDCGNLYGAIIVLGSSSGPTSKINVPIFINSTASFASIQNNTGYLIISQNSDVITSSGYHYLIDNSALREMVECGLYIENRNQNYDYLQRLTNTTGILSPYGIETIISGNSSLIKPQFSSYSYVDRRYNAGQVGSVYKGLPGCNSALMCNFDNPYPTRLDDSSGLFYSGNNETLRNMSRGK